MRIFSFLMAKRFFKPFLFGLGLFALLIFLGDLFDKMNHLVKSKASLLLIVEYLWLEVPVWAVRVIPMATLLATLFSITNFVQSGEWIAVQSCGFKASDFWKPVLGCSLLVTALSFAAQETVLPACGRRAAALWRESIHPEWEWDKYYDVALIGRQGQFISAHLFLPKEGKLERPVYERVGEKGVEAQFDAKLALWDGLAGRWVFYDGVERDFSVLPPRQTPFAKRDSDLDVPPKAMVPRARKADEMSFFEIRRFLSEFHPGVSRREYLAAAQAKLAYPFTNVILCALGIPIALRLRHAAKALIFCSALGLSFAYLWCIEVARALGAGGALPPFVAAWAANVVFGVLAAGLIKRYDV
jgi:lipopolysaccharide export system permease protein